MTGLFKDVLNDFSAMGADPAPVDVELLASEVLGQFHDVPLEDGEEPLGLELIAFAQRKITPGAAALLAALAVVAETDVERKAADSRPGDRSRPRHPRAAVGRMGWAASPRASAGAPVTSTATSRPC